MNSAHLEKKLKIQDDYDLSL